MKLNPESLEKAARTAWETERPDYDPEWGKVNEAYRIASRKLAAAAITAYLEAEIEAGRALDARGSESSHSQKGKAFIACDTWEDGEPCLILRLEADDARKE